MIWQEWSKTLKETLGLKGSPVAITFSIDPGREPSPGKHWVCQTIKDARDGKTVCLAEKNSACPGGAVYLGFRPRPSGEQARPLQRFLVHGEKLFCSVAAFHRAMALTTQPPLGLADRVLFAPLEAAETEPDLVLFLCSAEQACRLVTLATYSNGISPKVEMVGSACHMAIGYPLVSGEVNVSLLDYTARKMKRYDPNELIVTVPYYRMPDLLAAIPRCTAGAAKTEMPPEFAHLENE
ncbi:MAG TPA: DUF169 domain-containing protein [Sumerlaeia bacterium]|nr:DUF169 domain-containing protein [Sumerlaeia bacterium]